MTTTHDLKKGDFIRDGRGPTLVTTCTTGSESGEGGTNPASVASADDGKMYPDTALPLGGAAAVDMLIETTGVGDTTGDGGKLDCWIFNQYLRAWCRCPDLDRNVAQGLTRQMFAPLKIDARLGWICYLPNGVGVACKITLTAMPVRI